MFGPMFGSQIAIFGIPSGIFLGALSSVGLWIGWAWIIRITRGDREPRSFRATDDRRVWPSIGPIVGLALLGIATMALATAWLIVSPDAAGDGSSTSAIQTWLVLAGAVLVGLATILSLLRLWSRAHINDV